MILGANVVFGLGVAVIWTTVSKANKAKQQKRRVGYNREEVQIDPATIPEFHPTWRNTR